MRNRKAAIYGSFSAPKTHEIVVSRTKVSLVARARLKPSLTNSTTVLTLPIDFNISGPRAAEAGRQRQAADGGLHGSLRQGAVALPLPPS